MGVKVILKLGNKTLSKVSRKIERIDKEVVNLVKDLKDTLYATPGIGLAAPQIGVLKRVILVDLRNGGSPIVVINPKIQTKAGRIKGAEGCLSYPDYEGVVVRPRRVTVKGLNLSGTEVEILADGLLARALCHEIDHLDGILYMDKSSKIYKIEEK